MLWYWHLIWMDLIHQIYHEDGWTNLQYIRCSVCQVARVFPWNVPHFWLLRIIGACATAIMPKSCQSQPRLRWSVGGLYLGRKPLCCLRVLPNRMTLALARCCVNWDLLRLESSVLRDGGWHSSTVDPFAWHKTDLRHWQQAPPAALALVQSPTDLELRRSRGAGEVSMPGASACIVG